MTTIVGEMCRKPGAAMRTGSVTPSEQSWRHKEGGQLRKFWRPLAVLIHSPASEEMTIVAEHYRRQKQRRLFIKDEIERIINHLRLPFRATMLPLLSLQGAIA